MGFTAFSQSCDRYPSTDSSTIKPRPILPKKSKERNGKVIKHTYSCNNQKNIVLQERCCGFTEGTADMSTHKYVFVRVCACEC